MNRGTPKRATADHRIVHVARDECGSAHTVGTAPATICSTTSREILRHDRIRLAPTWRTEHDMDPMIWIPGGIVLTVVVIAVIVLSMRQRRR